MSVTELIKAPGANFIRTFTGGWINPLDPDPDAIVIEDIAHALANQCRFTGHVSKFYSVAQHSCHVSAYLEDKGWDYMWEGLLHDASEAYISDLARPVKRHPDIAGVYTEAEDRLMGVIAEKFAFTYPMSPECKEADDALLRSEQRDLMLGATSEGPVWTGTIAPWTPEEAEEVFLRYYSRLSAMAVIEPKMEYDASTHPFERLASGESVHWTELRRGE